MAKRRPFGLSARMEYGLKEFLQGLLVGFLVGFLIATQVI